MGKNRKKKPVAMPDPLLADYERIARQLVGAGAASPAILERPIVAFSRGGEKRKARWNGERR